MGGRLAQIYLFSTIDKKTKIRIKKDALLQALDSRVLGFMFGNISQAKLKLLNFPTDI